MIGKTISHYRIVEKLGEGGMGVVYRATDIKLNRDVAIKVLPGSLTDDRSRIERFRREAQLLAQLSSAWVMGPRARTEHSRRFASTQPRATH